MFGNSSLYTLSLLIEKKNFKKQFVAKKNKTKKLFQNSIIRKKKGKKNKLHTSVLVSNVTSYNYGIKETSKTTFSWLHCGFQDKS